MEYQKSKVIRVTHKIPPIYDHNSKVLILGTMPSPLSRQKEFYYAHPQNRFWHVLSLVFETELLQRTNEQKREFILQNGIALWDVLESCEIKGASDHSIQNPKANDITPILHKANIRKIFTTGKKAFTLYNKLIMPMTGIEPHPLPSSSAANFMN